MRTGLHPEFMELSQTVATRRPSRQCSNEIAISDGLSFEPEKGVVGLVVRMVSSQIAVESATANQS